MAFSRLILTLCQLKHKQKLDIEVSRQKKRITKTALYSLEKRNRKIVLVNTYLNSFWNIKYFIHFLHHLIVLVLAAPLSHIYAHWFPERRRLAFQRCCSRTVGSMISSQWRFRGQPNLGTPQKAQGQTWGLQATFSSVLQLSYYMLVVEGIWGTFCLYSLLISTWCGKSPLRHLILTTPGIIGRSPKRAPWLHRLHMTLYIGRFLCASKESF